MPLKGTILHSACICAMEMSYFWLLIQKLKFICKRLNFAVRRQYRYNMAFTFSVVIKFLQRHTSLFFSTVLCHHGSVPSVQQRTPAGDVCNCRVHHSAHLFEHFYALKESPSQDGLQHLLRMQIKNESHELEMEICCTEHHPVYPNCHKPCSLFWCGRKQWHCRCKRITQRRSTCPVHETALHLLCCLSCLCLTNKNGEASIGIGLLGSQNEIRKRIFSIESC